MELNQKTHTINKLNVSLFDSFYSTDVLSSFSSTTDLVPSLNFLISIFSLLQTNGITPEYIYIYTPKVIDINSLMQALSATTPELVNLKITNSLSVYNPHPNLEMEILLFKCWLMLRYLAILITPYLLYFMCNASIFMLDFYYKVFINIKFICKNLTVSCINKYKKLPRFKLSVDKLISGKNKFSANSIVNSAFISSYYSNFQVYMLRNTQYTDTQIFRSACLNMRNIIQNLSVNVYALTEYLLIHNITITVDEWGEMTIYIPPENSDEMAEEMENHVLQSCETIESMYDSLSTAHDDAVDANSDAITITGNLDHDPDYLMNVGTGIYNEYMEFLVSEEE